MCTTIHMKRLFCFSTFAMHLRVNSEIGLALQDVLLARSVTESAILCMFKNVLSSFRLKHVKQQHFDLFMCTRASFYILSDKHKRRSLGSS